MVVTDEPANIVIPSAYFAAETWRASEHLGDSIMHISEKIVLSIATVEDVELMSGKKTLKKQPEC